MKTLTVKTDTIKLLVQWSATFDQAATGGDCVEGPFMIKNGDTYYITFSANRYYSTKYSVQYATSDAPLGNFDRKYNNITLMCDDLNRNDTENPHLYGTGHHSFVEAPNGKDLLIIYHAHRAASSYVYTEPADLVSPRSVCVDLAWFTEDGKLVAGSKETPTVPTATAQSVLEGTSLARETHFDGAFEAIPTLPTVYVAQQDGLDANAGTKDAPFKTLEKALLTLTNGGTIVLTQSYSAGTLLNVPVRSGPIRITAEHNNVILTYKFIKLNTDVYFDTIIFAPETVNEISVIECNFNNVVMGEGVSCLNRPLTRDYPYLVGGKWQYTGSDKSAVYNSFMPSDSKLSSTESYNVTVLGGTWEAVFAGSVKQNAPVDGSAPSGVLTVGENARVIKGASPAVEVKMTVGSVTAYVNGIAKTLDAAPVIKNSRTMLPVRFVAESFDAKVEWDGATSTAILVSGDTRIEITVGSPVAKINGADTKLDAPAYIDPASNRTYLPVRFVAEALGATVSWNGETSTATLAK